MVLANPFHMRIDSKAGIPNPTLITTLAVFRPTWLSSLIPPVSEGLGHQSCLAIVGHIFEKLSLIAIEA